jgi:hypothetical protein
MVLIRESLGAEPLTSFEFVESVRRPLQVNVLDCRKTTSAAYHKRLAQQLHLS